MNEYIYPSTPDPNILSSRITAYQEGNPVIGIALLNACDTGLDNEFADALLYPYTDSNATDQAEIGWRICVPIDFSQTGSTAFWQTLQNGGRAHQARDQMVWLTYGYNKLPTDYASCWGDYNATLHRAYPYSGNTLQTMWYGVVTGPGP